LLRALLVVLAFAASAGAQGQAMDQLLKATNQGDAKAVAALIDRGLDPDSADPDGNTLLMIASRLGHQDLVTALIARKASVTKRSPHGDTALLFASLKGHLGVVRLLVEHGAQISQDGWAPIHYAAFEGRTEVLKYLLGKGADKNALGPNGFTALMLAARGGYVDAARVLLYEDADVGVRGPAGETALGIAKTRKNIELEALLRRAGAVD
jgi:ankyrin repeat protein